MCVVGTLHKSYIHPPLHGLPPDPTRGASSLIIHPYPLPYYERPYTCTVNHHIQGPLCNRGPNIKRYNTCITIYCHEWFMLF